MSRDFVLYSHVTPEAVFHGYILGYFIGVRWNLKPTGGMGNESVNKIVRQYLGYACEDNQWLQRQILDVIRDANRADLRWGTKQILPSLFNRRRQKKLQVPNELNGKDIKFDIDLINKLKEEVASIKKEFNMNNENTTADGENVEVSVNSEQAGAPVKEVAEVKKSDPNITRAVRFKKENNVVTDQLTVENFREMTGRKFRMTKDQQQRVEAGTLTRAEAFEEFKTALKSLDGEN